MNLATPHHIAQVLLTSSLWMLSSLIGIAPANTAESKSSFIFECSRDPQTRLYSTIIKYTNSKNKELIRWQSDVIKNPKQTCRDVSDRFDVAWDTKRLNYLKSGNSQKTGLKIVCGLAKEKILCDDSNKLFELSPGNNSQKLVTDLIKGINKADNSTRAIIQSSGEEITIDLSQLIF